LLGRWGSGTGLGRVSWAAGVLIGQAAARPEAGCGALGRRVSGSERDAAEAASAMVNQRAHGQSRGRCNLHLRAELGAIAARWERRCSCRPCHPRAGCSGHEWYVAVSQGLWGRAVRLGAPRLIWSS
jgi:hypothetical protein